MFKQLKLVTSLAVTVTLVACGGGGDIDIDSSSVSVNNPLKKYEGIYQDCDNNEKTIYSLLATGTDGLNLNYSQELYENSNCSGELLASYKWNEPALITYKDTISAMQTTQGAVNDFPSSVTVDRVTVLTRPSTATLTGSRVIDNCVIYWTVDNMGMPVGSKICFDLMRQSRTSTGSLYLTADNQRLVQFLPHGNGDLYCGRFLATSWSFNCVHRKAIVAK
jgi:hypothetical protein